MPTSLICIRLISRGYSPWRPDADIGTDAVTRVLHLTVRVFNVPVPSGKLRESDGARARQETPHNAPLPVLSDSRARFTCSVWPEQIFTPQTAWYWAFPQLVALPRTGPVGASLSAAGEKLKSIQSRGSWGLAFALATLSSRGAIKPAFTFMVYASFRSTLSRSWDTRVSIRRVYRPSQTPHPVVVLSSRDALREALDSTQRLSGLNAAGFRPLIRELVNGRRS